MNEISTFARRVRVAKPREKRYEIRDDVVTGLTLRVFPSGARTFALESMVRGRRRYAWIGNADTTTIPEARREARKLIASYIEPAKKDGGPKTPGHPMTAFAAEFLDRQARRWKPRTLETNIRIVRNNILLAFGHLTVDAIAVEQVRDWFASMAERPGIANRAMPVLSVMMKMAELWGYRTHNSNPCKNTKRYRMPPKERFLTSTEMARLNAVLTRDEFWCPHIVAIVRLLMLTGCRVGEILSLEWDWIKGKRIHLPDAKSGPRTVWLSSPAGAVIDAIPRYSEDCPYLFPARPATRPLDNITFQWDRMRLAARVRSPRERSVCERDLQLAALEQDRPELRDLLALRDRVGGDEADAGIAALHILSRLNEPRGDIIERAAAPAEGRHPAHLGALVRRLVLRAHEGRIALHERTFAARQQFGPVGFQRVAMDDVR